MLALQLYAEKQNDAKLMVDIMKLLNKNNLPMQPGTADCIFRYIISAIPNVVYFSIKDLNFNFILHIYYLYDVVLYKLH